MSNLQPKLAFSDTVFMHNNPFGFLTKTLRKSEKRDAIEAVRKLRSFGYNILGFEWVDRLDSLASIRSLLPRDIQLSSLHAPLFPAPKALFSHLLDAPSFSYGIEIFAEYAISGTFKGRVLSSNAAYHVNRIEEVASFYSTDVHNVPVTTHPYCIEVLGQQNLFPRPKGSPNWAIEPDYPRPNQRRSQALISDLERVVELANTFGCSINIDTSHIRLSGNDLIKSWEYVYRSGVHVEIMHLVGCRRHPENVALDGGHEISKQSLSIRDLQEYAEFIQHIRKDEDWNGLVVVEISPIRARGSKIERIAAIQRTLDFYLGDYKAFKESQIFSFPGPPESGKG